MNTLSRDRNVPRVSEEYITQVADEVEGRMNKKMSQEFSRTEIRIPASLSKVEDFLLNSHVRV